jgi:hypothetical protein
VACASHHRIGIRDLALLTSLASLLAGRSKCLSELKRTLKPGTQSCPPSTIVHRVCADET